VSQLARCKWCERQIRITVVNPGTKAERVIWSHDFQAPAIPCLPHLTSNEKHVAEPTPEPAQGSQQK
jgi:hypothetical protein